MTTINEILDKKLKNISKIANIPLKKVNIATEDRPYRNKPDSNLTQIQHEKELGSKQVANREQTDRKQVAKNVLNREQTGSKRVAKIPFPLKTGSKEVDKQVAQGPAPITLKELVGIQYNIIVFFYFLSKTQASQSTGLLTLQHTANSLKIKKNIIKDAINRLQKKGCIYREVGKPGRGGWSSYTIANLLYKELMQHDNFGYLKSIIGSKEVDKQVASTSSSSSINFNKTTTTLEATEPPFEFDIEPLADIGFTHNNVNQLMKQGKLTPEQIQQSIEHFAFDLEHNDRAKTFKLAPLDVFMGIMRKGSYYNAPSNYESQKDLNLRLSLEAKMNREQARKELEEKLKEVEWKEWSEKLTEEELMEFYVEDKPLNSTIPEKVQRTIRRRNALNNAREYFESEIWPLRLEEVTNETIRV